MYFKIIKSIDQLLIYRNQYDNLINMHAGEEYYYYLYGNLKCLSEFIDSRVSICLILIFNNNKLVGIAPFQIRKRHIIYLANKLLQFIGTGNHPLDSKYGSIIYDLNENKSIIDRSILSAIYSSDMPLWDELLFDNLKFDTCPPLSEYFHYFKENSSSCYRSPETYSDNEFLHKYLKRKSRSKLNSSKRKLLNDFTSVEFMRLTKFDQDIIDEISILHSIRQQYKRNNLKYKHYHSLFDNTLERESFFKLTRWLADIDKLSIFLLKVNNKVISFIYCIDIKTISNAIIMAFDMNYQQYSPSKLLALHAFNEQSSRDEFRQIDFLEDLNLFKKQLCPVEIKRISANAANHRSLLSRVKWLYIRFTKHLISQLKKNVIPPV